MLVGCLRVVCVLKRCMRAALWFVACERCYFRASSWALRDVTHFLIYTEHVNEVFCIRILTALSPAAALLLSVDHGALLWVSAVCAAYCCAGQLAPLAAVLPAARNITLNALLCRLPCIRPVSCFAGTRCRQWCSCSSSNSPWRRRQHSCRACNRISTSLCCSLPAAAARSTRQRPQALAVSLTAGRRWPQAAAARRQHTAILSAAAAAACRQQQGRGTPPAK
jgi:hypothetical protein